MGALPFHHSPLHHTNTHLVPHLRRNQRETVACLLAKALASLRRRNVTNLGKFIGAITTGCMRPFVPRTNKNERTTLLTSAFLKRSALDHVNSWVFYFIFFEF